MTAPTNAKPGWEAPLSEMEVEEMFGGGRYSRSAKAAASPYSAPAEHAESVTTFSRRELDQILAIYGRKVAEGEWRDYAIDHLRDRAVFSIFRRTSEFPLYRVEKTPKLARRQGAYSVIAATGLILKRGHELAKVLRVLDPNRDLRLVEH